MTSFQFRLIIPSVALIVSGLVHADPVRKFETPYELPDGLELVEVASPPLVIYPLMGSFDDQRRLYIGDAAGLNLHKNELEAQLPNRIVRLEDTDGDGIFDRSDVFVDKLTFPQGACWLDGSLYVASPPGIWKFTDTDGDGVADKRRMIVGGFDFTGNAADVHGPFLHPFNGRLYWCHGRKGHRVTQQDGTLVHEGLASGLWSCLPDGSDVQWESLGNMDNPVEIDFLPDGQIIGTTNILFARPRGDVLQHWLYGAVYDERPEWKHAVAGLPRTIEHMPMAYNYGHAAVAGMLRYRSGQLNPAWQDNIFVVLYNTQRIVRMVLEPVGATYTAHQREFFKLSDSDAHLTDIIEDADGSLLVLNTGGWFRIGCPGSLASKPDHRGAIYRIRKIGAVPPRDPLGLTIDWTGIRKEAATTLMNDARWRVRERAARIVNPVPDVDATPGALLNSTLPRAQLLACESIARSGSINPAQRGALLSLLAQEIDPALEHAAMYAAIVTRAFDSQTFHETANSRQMRRLLQVVSQMSNEPMETRRIALLARQQIDSKDAELAHAAVNVMCRLPGAVRFMQDDLSAQITSGNVSNGSLAVIQRIASEHMSDERVQGMVSLMLASPNLELRRAAWRTIAGMTAEMRVPGWIPSLKKALRNAGTDQASSADLVLVLDAISRIATADFESDAQRLTGSENTPWIRLKALSILARPGHTVSPPTFGQLIDIARSGESPMSRLEAAKLLAQSSLTKEQKRAIGAVLPELDATSLLAVLALLRREGDQQLLDYWAEQVARSPHVGSMGESLLRTQFRRLPAEKFDAMIGPIVRRAAEEREIRRRRLERLVARIGDGNVASGEAVFRNSTCVACHGIGGNGGGIGPDLSHIGSNRSSRDLIESILFPSETIVREFEYYQIDTADGRSLQGMIRGETSEGLLLMGGDGAQHLVPHASIVSRQAVPASVMPEGLDLTLNDQQLLDLVAWLISLK